MKKPVAAFLLIIACVTVLAQHKQFDTLYVALSKAKVDSMRYKALGNLLVVYDSHPNPDSTIILAEQALLLAEKNNWKLRQEICLNYLANAYGDIGEYVKSMSFYFKAVKIADDLNRKDDAAQLNSNIAAVYIEREDYRKALQYLRAGQKDIDADELMHKSSDDREVQALIHIHTGNCYLHLKLLDSAAYILNLTYKECSKNKSADLVSVVQLHLGELEAEKGNKNRALQFFRKTISHSQAIQDSAGINLTCISIANLYHKFKQQDSAEYYARRALAAAESVKFAPGILNAGKLLYTFYDEDHNLPLAYKYFKIATTAKDSLYNQDKEKRLLSIDFTEKERQQELQTAQKEARTDAVNRLRTYLLAGGLGVLLLLSLIFWRNIAHRKRANALLQSQNAEIERQKKSVEDTLAELKTTQTQLVQREKMASLGELTAGIAHEIQNPLNFVNNFSEVNKEILEELKAESEKPKARRDEQLVGELINDLIENEKKINHHGKRADSIVKGMLEHSRSRSGQKEPTDINTMADEFIRLSYHGLRSKDKSFNAELTTNFDTGLPKINVVQQDIGRVLLNLFNNAFYAVNQKQKTAGPAFKPEVTVTTSTENNQVIIKVKDNGTGIPDAIKEKIMQPFFTTKPTGEGTGLGLSLTYDMVVKGHGGSIDVNSQEGESTEFIIKLPVS